MARRWGVKDSSPNWELAVHINLTFGGPRIRTPSEIDRQHVMIGMVVEFRMSPRMSKTKQIRKCGCNLAVFNLVPLLTVGAVAPGQRSNKGEGRFSCRMFQIR